MEERIYLNLDGDGYLLSLYEAADPEPGTSGGTAGPCVTSLGGLDLAGDRIRAHRWDGETLVFDAERWAQIETEEQEQTSAVTREDRLEAQLYYTAMMTDTLLEV